MITKLEILLRYEYKEKLTYQIASTMQGVLMELIDPEYGEFLHDNGLKPYHQYVSEMTENSFRWNICTLDQNAREKIINVLSMQKCFILKHKNINLQVVEQSQISRTYESLISDYYFQKQPRDITFHFLSPTAFKSQGRYVIIPDVKLIFQSLMNKYDAFSKETKVSDDIVLEHIENHCYIKKYNLKSVRFSMEGTYVNAFIGELTVHINGPEQLVNLCNMMAVYGQYAGIGIKCSMGMGAVEIKKNGGKVHE